MAFPRISSLSVDPVTLFTLVCTVEALLSSGITDPYELYLRYVHLSEVGNCIGAGLRRPVHEKGCTRPDTGMRMFKVIFFKKPSSILSTLGSTCLLLSSTGPIRSPVGACATSVESLDTAHDLITAGRARVPLSLEASTIS